MAITTTLGHVSRAIDFYNKPSIFFGFGKQTPWANEDAPDAPLVSATAIEEPLGYKQIESKYMVVPDENGTIVYRDSRWSAIPVDQAYDKKCRWVYIECYLRYDELPLGEYRQMGVLTGLTRKVDVPSGKPALLPEEVDNPGILEVLDNSKVTTRNANQKELLSIILEY
jgi:hypothetical protein